MLTIGLTQATLAGHAIVVNYAKFTVMMSRRLGAGPCFYSHVLVYTRPQTCTSQYCTICTGLLTAGLTIVISLLSNLCYEQEVALWLESMMRDMLPVCIGLNVGFKESVTNWPRVGICAACDASTVAINSPPLNREWCIVTVGFR